MKQNYFWLKLIGKALLLHIVLIVLSILEVAVYSYLINPGHPNQFYEAHATQSAPWISYTFGTLFTFLLVRRFLLKFKQQQLLYALGLPIIYGIIDYLLLVMMSGGATVLPIEFIIGKVLKIAAGIVAYFMYAEKSKP